MSDLISRQAAIDAVNCVTVMKGIRSGKSVTAEAVDCAKRIIADNIRQLPPIQPEIVRCKDCKYAEYIDDVKTLWCTECGQGRTVAPYDFCSYGERRDNE